ncbi:uncharacterized protein LOC117586161 [Drosophila guanche]|nr:uncharacterized protein LOC117586161 [Drosophila guanche]
MDSRETIVVRKTMGVRQTMDPVSLRYSRLWSSTFTIDENVTCGFPYMAHRHPQDKLLIVPGFQDVPEEVFDPKFTPPYCDDREMFIDPNYETFPVPLNVRCLERYGEAKRLYNRQLNRELKKLIENQPTADCAWQFVRTLSYSSLWPPLHTREELKLFEREFCKLSPEEKRNYDQIMKTTFT